MVHPTSFARPLWGWGVLIAAMLSALPSCGLTPAGASPAAGELGRCLWVTRWDYRSAGDIRGVMADAAAAGFDTVLFQVRGAGTVHWQSQVEVWAARYGHRHPGFDPLEVAVQEGRLAGLAVHAWVNVMPGARGAQLASEPRQLWNLRPGWFLQDADGERAAPGTGGYLYLNPAHPRVREYLADLCGELVSRYGVAGVHLDHIRFPDRGPTGPMRGPLARPRDPQTLAAFQRDHPGTPATGSVFAGWLQDQVTAVVAGIRRTLRVADPDALLTVAVWSDPERARDRVLQPWPDWVRQRLVDAVFPMNYTDDMTIFRERLARDAVACRGVPMVVGVGSYLHPEPGTSIQQLDAAMASGAAGVSVFGYDTLFGASEGAGDDDSVSGAAGTRVRAALRRRIGSWNLTRSR